jgi:hypothetical protein
MKRILLAGAVLGLLLPASARSITRAPYKHSTSSTVAIGLNEPAGTVYRPGEKISLTYTVGEEAYVIIYDIDTDGFVHLLFPGDGDALEKSSPGRKYTLPAGGESDFVVNGSTGIEYVFALAVPDKSLIKDEEIDFLAGNENLPQDERFRIDGDPLLASNTVASELVRGISRAEGVSLAYTSFYINEEVTHPRYLCAQCHEKGKDPYKERCEKYRFTATELEGSGLGFPLERGFDVALAGDEGDESIDEDEDEGESSSKIYISFYPYHSYVYVPPTFVTYYDPWFSAPLWYDPWWGYWDPFYYGGGFSFYSAWGWDWGYWGTSWYYPYYWDYWGYGYYPSYGFASHRLRPHGSKYRSTLYAATSFNAARNPDLRINSIRYKNRREEGRKALRHDLLVRKRTRGSASSSLFHYRNRTGAKGTRHVTTGTHRTRTRAQERGLRHRATKRTKSPARYESGKRSGKKKGHVYEKPRRGKSKYHYRTRSERSGRGKASHRSGSAYRRHSSGGRHDFSRPRSSRGSAGRSSHHGRGSKKR